MKDLLEIIRDPNFQQQLRSTTTHSILGTLRSNFRRLTLQFSHYPPYHIGQLNIGEGQFIKGIFLLKDRSYQTISGQPICLQDREATVLGICGPSNNIYMCQLTGEGSITYTIGRRSTGTWEIIGGKNRLTGEGSITLTNGARLTGTWKIINDQNIFTGEGSITLTNGAIYTGNWGIIRDQNILTGEGSITWTDGVSFTGNWGIIADQSILTGDRLLLCRIDNESIWITQQQIDILNNQN